MGALSSKLRSAAGGFLHWCPGCNGPHMIYTVSDGHPTWQWNGHVLKPTTTPSVRNFTTNDKEGKPLPNGATRTLCHYFLTDGNIAFCGDCEHALSGKTVPLPDFPHQNWD